MKKFIPTLVLLIVCIGGFLYAKSHNFFKEKVEDKHLVKVVAADVKGIQIIDADGTLQLQKNDKTWTMSKPQAYPVDKFEPDTWVGALADLQYDNKITDNATDLAQYGLDKPAEQFQVTLNDGSVHTLQIGKALPVPGTSYGKVDGAPAVYEIADQTWQGVDKKTLDFLDKNVISFQYDKIKSLSMEWKGDKWVLAKADAGKTVYDSNYKMGPLDLTAQEGTGVLDKLISFTTEVMVQPVSSVKLDKPELKVTLTQTDNGQDTTTNYVGQIDGDNIWVAQVGGKWAYQVPVSMVQDFFDKGKNPKNPTSAAASPAPQAPAGAAK